MNKKGVSLGTISSKCEKDLILKKNKQCLIFSPSRTMGNKFQLHKILKYVKTARPSNGLLRVDVGFPSCCSFQGQVRQSIKDSSSTAGIAWELWSGESFPMMRKFFLKEMKFEMT